MYPYSVEHIHIFVILFLFIHILASPFSISFYAISQNVHKNRQMEKATVTILTASVAPLQVSVYYSMNTISEIHFISRIVFRLRYNR